MIRAAASALLVVASALAPYVARAQSLQEFEGCRAAYEAADYARAAQCFENVLEDAGAGAIANESHKYLGSAYLFLGRRDAAIRQFELLLRADPTSFLDPLLFPAAAQEMFSNVRDRLSADARAAAERAELERQLEAERARSQQLLTIADSEVLVDVENSRWAALLPWGIGQFLNGDDGLGWFFFLSETAFALTAIGSLAWHDDLIRQAQIALQRGLFDEVLRANDLLDAAAYTNWIALGALGVLAIAGIIEAQVAFQPSRSVRHRRPVPDELREGLSGTEEEVSPPPAAPAVSLIPFGLRF